MILYYLAHWHTTNSEKIQNLATFSKIFSKFGQIHKKSSKFRKIYKNTGNVKLYGWTVGSGRDDDDDFHKCAD
jgi:hypothetical protein